MPSAMASAIANDMERILPPSQNGSPDSGGSSGGLLLGTENGINGTGNGHGRSSSSASPGPPPPLPPPPPQLMMNNSNNIYKNTSGVALYANSSVPNPHTPRKKKVADRPPVAPPNLSSYYEDNELLGCYANQAMDSAVNGGAGVEGLRGGVTYSSGGGIVPIPNGFGHHDGMIGFIPQPRMELGNGAQNDVSADHDMHQHQQNYLHHHQYQQQEVIEVQILPQDDHWGEGHNQQQRGAMKDPHASLAAATVDAGSPNKAKGGINQNNGEVIFDDQTGFNVSVANRLNLSNGRKGDGDAGGGGGQKEKKQINVDLGRIATAVLCVVSFLSPIAMVAVPQISNVFSLKGKQLLCGVDCYGMLVSLAFRLFVLATGTWAVFCRPSRASVPRLRLFRCVVAALATVFLASFWLFYASHLAHGEEKDVTYPGLVQFALSLTDSLLFVHYLALILIELRHRRSQHYVKVVRSPDGESRAFALGAMSVQMAAAAVLDKYYTEFPIHNPYLDRSAMGGMGGNARLRSGKNGGGVKMYGDLDASAAAAAGGGKMTPNNDCNSTVVSVASKLPGARSSSGDRPYYDEYEFERKARKRRARLVSAAEDAFTHIKRIRKDQLVNDKSPMESYEAAQAIFPTLSRALQKYLRTTRQQPRHSVESILRHLADCLSFDMSPSAFLEKYLVESPVMQNDLEAKPSQDWSLVSERSLYRDIRAGSTFQLRQGDVSLLCTVQDLPHFNISEEIIDAASNRFVLKLSSETSV